MKEYYCEKGRHTAPESQFRKHRCKDGSYTVEHSCMEHNNRQRSETVKGRRDARQKV